MRQVLAALGALAALTVVGAVTWVIASPDSDSASTPPPATVRTTSGPSEPAPDSPDTLTLTIVIADNLPLDLYFNKDGVVCAVDAPGVDGDSATVTVRDASGSIVATADSPAEGGQVQDAGCLVPVYVEAPVSSFYEVELSAGGGALTRTQTVDAARAQTDPIRFDV